jgi:hypothetical protein
MKLVRLASPNTCDQRAIQQGEIGFARCRLIGRRPVYWAKRWWAQEIRLRVACVATISAIQRELCEPHLRRGAIVGCRALFSVS